MFNYAMYASTGYSLLFRFEMRLHATVDAVKTITCVIFTLKERF